MKLTESQAETLAHCRIDADLSVADLAKRCGLKVNTVRSALSRLEDRGIIGKSALFDVSKIGFVEYDFLCSLGTVPSKIKQQFLQHLKKSPLVTFVTETGGEYNFIFTLCVATPAVVDVFLSDLGERFGDLFRTLDLAIMLNRAIFGPKFLASKKRPKHSVTVSSGSPSCKYDAIDRRILKALSENGNHSVRSLAAQLGVPHSTIGDRLRRLRESGVLLGTFWSFNSQALGLSEYRVVLAMRNFSPEVKKEAFTFARDHPHVTYYLEYLGRWQFCFGIVIYDAAQAAELVNELNERFAAKLERANLIPVVGDHKVELFSMFVEDSGRALLSEEQLPEGLLT